MFRVVGTALVNLSLKTPSGVVTGGQADRVLVKKEAHTLTLFRHGQVLRTYEIEEIWSLVPEDAPIEIDRQEI